MTLDDLYRLLRSGHVQTQGIVDTLPSPLLVLDQNYNVAGGNKAFFTAFKLDREEVLGRSVFEISDGQWSVPELKQLLSDVIPKSSAIVGYRMEGMFPGIGKRQISLSAHRLAHPDNNSTSLLLQFDDVTDASRADAARDILLEETRHRLRNLVTVVTSLAQQTRAKDRNGEEYRDAFLGRLHAVLRAQEFGHNQNAPADLETTLRETVQGNGDASRIDIAPGPQTTLSGEQVVPMNLILHELSTNSVKYGALSSPEGRVAIGWTVEDRGAENGQGKRLKLRWRERGGPKVRPPTQKGFGTKLIEFSAQGDLQGGAELSYRPDGFEAEISATLKA